MSQAMVQPRQSLLRAEQIVNRPGGIDEGPAPFAIGRFPSQQQKTARRDQCDEFVMLPLEVRLLDARSEIPDRFPITEAQTDAALAEHRGLVTRIERRRVKRLFRAQGMAEATDALLVH